MTKRIDFFPRAHAAFDVYATAVVQYLSNAGNAIRLGISGANLTALKTLFSDWQKAFMTAGNPATTNATAVHKRNTIKKQLQQLLRSIYRDMPKSVLTETDRTTMNLAQGIAKHSAIHKPQIAPVVVIEKIQHLQHTLRFQNPDTPNSHAKPYGVNAVELYHHIGSEAPAEKEFRHIASTGRFLHIVGYGLQDTGKTVWYIARYRSTRGEFGTWSMPVQAIIA